MNDELPSRRPVRLEVHLDFTQHLQQKLRREWLTSRIDRVPHLITGFLSSTEEHACLLFRDLLRYLVDLGVQFRPN